MKNVVLSLLVGLCLHLAAVTTHAAEQVTVANERLSVTLASEAHGAALVLRDLATGRDLLAKQSAPQLFQLEFSSTAEANPKRIYVSSRDAKKVVLRRIFDGKRTTGRAEFSNFGGQEGRVVCTVTATPGDPMLRWRIEASFPEGFVLENVRFPILTLRAPLAAEHADALVLGATKGGVHHQPSAWKPGRATSAAQPGSLAAQFACYYDAAGGLFTAAFDSRGYRKSVIASRTAEGLSIAWLHPCFVKTSFALDFDVVQTTFRSEEPATATDWRHAADLYKQWAVGQPWCARTFAARDDLPAWLKAGPAMVRFHREALAEPKTIEAWLKTYWQGNVPAKPPLIIAYWGWEKVATWITPDYFPFFPSDETFLELARLGRSIGGHTFLWPSGYHYTVTFKKQPDGTFAWDDRARFDAEARAHAICARDGKVTISPRFWLQGGECATLCPGDPWTIDWFNKIAVGLVQRGADMVQVDQVVGGNFPPCYSKAHGHEPGPGLWTTEVFHKQLETMLAACRKVNPEAVVCFEEPNEQFIQHAAIQDYRDWEVLKRDGVEPASVFNYIYHEYLPTFQSNPQPGNRLQSAYCLVNGQIPHFVPARDVGPGPLLVGGDFETWRTDASTGWDKVDGYQGRAYAGKSAHDQDQRHGGRASLRLTNDKEGEIVQVSQNVRVGGNFQIGKTYRVSVWMKSSGLKQRNAIGLGAFTDLMKSTGSWHIAMPAKAGDWVRGEATFTLPANTQFLRIMLHMNGPGTVWFDDMTLEEVRSDGSAVVVQRPDKPTDHELMRQWVELFHGEGRPYLLLGKMLHPPKLETATFEYQKRRFPAILHNAFEAADGSQAVVLVNATDQPQTGKLTWRGQVQPLSLQAWEVRLVR
ncbi:MAG: DUF6259 domain-containing protein [Thermoguttaceae bacterium]